MVGLILRREETEIIRLVKKVWKNETTILLFTDNRLKSEGNRFRQFRNVWALNSIFPIFIDILSNLKFRLFRNQNKGFYVNFDKKKFWF